jgi:TolB-like protein/DNA-binding winged helix-turn-helix (wHTH) protein/tetratricopeptide (TPR) repeat protein
MRTAYFEAAWRSGASVDVRLKDGFRLGDYRIFPLEGRVIGVGTDLHIQPKAMEVLLALGSRPQQVVSRSELLEAVWSGIVVGDEVLTRCIHELRHTFADDANDPTLIATIPKRGYRLLVAPEPLEPPASVTTVPEPALGFAVRRYMLATLAAALVVSIILFGTRFLPTPEQGAVRIAVMPFCNIGGDADNVYYSDGVASDVIDYLATHPDSRVVARTSSFQFGCKDASVADAASTLGVDYIVEGSVRRDRNTLHVSASLVDSAGFALWSSTYTRSPDKVFDITGSVAKSIEEKLGLNVDPAAQTAWRARAPAALESYDYYKLGQYYVWRRTASDIERAIELFNTAIQKDAKFALAYTGLADAYALLAVYGDISSADAAARMQGAVDTALELDSELPEAYTSLGSLLELRGEYSAAADAYQAAIKRKPSFALAHMWLGHVLMLQDKVSEALGHFEHAYALDRLNVVAGVNVARALGAGGQGDQALRLLAELRENFPEDAVAHIGTSMWARAYGQFDISYKSARQLVKMTPEDPTSNALLGQAAISLDSIDEGLTQLSEALRLAPQNWVIIDWYADGLFLLGHFQEQHSFLEQQLQQADAQNIRLAGRERRILDLRVGQARLMVGDTAGAIERLDAGFDELVRVPIDVTDEIMYLGYRALAYRESGADKTADRVLAEALRIADVAEQNGFKAPIMNVRIAAILALSGKADQSLDRLDAALSHGFLEYRVLTRDPAWNSLRGSPDFERIVQEMQTRTRLAAAELAE